MTSDHEPYYGVKATSHKSVLKFSLLSFSISILAGCGGGSSSSGTKPEPTPTPISCKANQYLDKDTCKDKIAQNLSDFSLPSLIVGERLSLQDKTTAGLVVQYQNDTPTICKVEAYQLTAIGAGDCKITVLQAGDTTHSTFKTSLSSKVKYLASILELTSTSSGELSASWASVVKDAAFAKDVIYELHISTQEKFSADSKTLK